MAMVISSKLSHVSFQDLISSIMKGGSLSMLCRFPETPRLDCDPTGGCGLRSNNSNPGLTTFVCATNIQVRDHGHASLDPMLEISENRRIFTGQWDHKTSQREANTQLSPLPNGTCGGKTIKRRGMIDPRQNVVKQSGVKSDRRGRECG